MRGVLEIGLETRGGTARAAVRPHPVTQLVGQEVALVRDRVPGRMAVLECIGAVIQQSSLACVSTKSIPIIILDHGYRMHGIGLAELPDLVVVGIRQCFSPFNRDGFQIFRAKYGANPIFRGAMLELVDRAGKPDQVLTRRSDTQGSELLTRLLIQPPA